MEINFLPELKPIYQTARANQAFKDWDISIPFQKEVYAMTSDKAVVYRGAPVMDMISGSSLNRMYAKRKRDIANQDLPANSDNDGNELQQLVQQLHKAKAAARRIKRRELAPKTDCGQLLHFLSKRSSVKLRNKIMCFYRSCPYKTFVTLTFVNAVEDKTAIAILNKFLTAVRSRFLKDEFQYIWVAERQMSNEGTPDNIHFHMICNQFLDVNTYNPLWVLQQYNAGIKNDKVSQEDMKLAYDEGSMKKLLNPFDIVKVSDIDGLSTYLTEYVSKTAEARQGFTCRVWHCSKQASRMFTKKLITKNDFNETATAKNTYLNKKTGAFYEHKTYVTEHAIVRMIVNKKYFNAKNLSDLDSINAMILQGGLPTIIPQIEYDEYFTNYIAKEKREEYRVSTNNEDQRLRALPERSPIYSREIFKSGSSRIGQAGYDVDPF